MSNKSQSQSQPAGNHVVPLFRSLSPIPEDRAPDIHPEPKQNSHQSQDALTLACRDTNCHANITTTAIQQASDKDLHPATAQEQSRHDDGKEEENLLYSRCLAFPLPASVDEDLAFAGSWVGKDPLPAQTTRSSSHRRMTRGYFSGRRRHRYPVQLEAYTMQEPCNEPWNAILGQEGRLV